MAGGIESHERLRRGVAGRARVHECAQRLKEGESRLVSGRVVKQSDFLPAVFISDQLAATGEHC